MPRAGQRVLDLAGGTGDLARLFAARVGPTGTVVHTDINGAMLAEGRDKLLNAGLALPTIQCNAEALPFAAPDVRRRLHRIRPAQCHAQGRGARRDAARAASRRSRGRAGVLAVACPARARLRLVQLQRAAEAGQVDRAGTTRSYRYLAESIRVHPDQETLKQMMRDAGFDRVEFHNLTAGVVAVHVGWMDAVARRIETWSRHCGDTAELPRCASPGPPTRCPNTVIQRRHDS